MIFIIAHITFTQSIHLLFYYASATVAFKVVTLHVNCLLVFTLWDNEYVFKVCNRSHILFDHILWPFCFGNRSSSLLNIIFFSDYNSEPKWRNIRWVPLKWCLFNWSGLENNESCLLFLWTRSAGVRVRSQARSTPRLCVACVKVK